VRGHSGHRRYLDRKTGKLRKTSTWTVWYELPRRPGEPRKQKIKGGFTSRKDAVAWFTKKAEELRQGIASTDDRQTIEQYLTQWLVSIEGAISASALHAYRNHVEEHIIPAIGRVRLTELRALHIEEAVRTWQTKAAGRRKIKVQLSSRTVGHVFATLRTALKRAVRQRSIAWNPCDGVDAPPSSGRRCAPSTLRARRR
jgi:integrase